ncbi:MAG: sugar transferase, partial [Neisseriaceae bacterium]|nr:sugar transferase [Neisseriaceae bacterium]
MYQLYYKRVFDVVVSICALMFLLPLFVFIAVLILLERRGPVFFTQIRVGQFGQEFPIYKFRTMVVASEELGQLSLKNDARITRLGHILRQTK